MLVEATTLQEHWGKPLEDLAEYLDTLKEQHATLTNKLLENEALYEDSLNNVFKFISEPRYAFGIISAYRRKNTDAENVRYDIILNRYFRNLIRHGRALEEPFQKNQGQPFRGFYRLYGNWIESGSTDEKTKDIDTEKKGIEHSSEPLSIRAKNYEISYLLPFVTKQFVQDISKHFNQDSFIYKDAHEFTLYVAERVDNNPEKPLIMPYKPVLSFAAGAMKINDFTKNLSVLHYHMNNGNLISKQKEKPLIGIPFKFLTAEEVGDINYGSAEHDISPNKYLSGDKRDPKNYWRIIKSGVGIK